MQAELSRCIAASQQFLADFAPYAASDAPHTMHPHLSNIIATVAACGIPRIEDSRVPRALNDKLHAIAELHVQQAYLALQDSHRHLDPFSLHRAAIGVKECYTALYEQKILEAVKLRPRPSNVSQKQPYANDVLTYAFEQSPTPTRRERERLAALTGLTLEQVRVWFQNRRSRVKKKAPELQGRPALRLPDLLQRVVASSKAAESMRSHDVTRDDYEDDHDSGYCSGAETSPASHWHQSNERTYASLTTPNTTSRSFPAAYVPQPLASHLHSDPPAWRRIPTSRPLACACTVTVDELARSMSRLTLRHRRQTTNPGTSDAATAVSAPSSIKSVAAAAAAAANRSTAPSKKKPTRKQAENGRKVAGSRRATSCVSTIPIPPVNVAQGAGATSAQSSGLLALVPDTMSNVRKKAGLPRRTPAGTVLSRQSSAVSVGSASSHSSESSRCTSYASDFSLDSVASDSSFTSVESMVVTSAEDGLPSAAVPPRQPLEPVTLFETQRRDPCDQGEPVPVYDFSNSYELPLVAGPPLDLNDPEMLQLLRDAQMAQQQLSDLPMPITDDDHQPSNVGGVLDGLIDFSSAPFPNLDTLFSDALAAFPRPSHSQAAPLVGLPIADQMQGFSWSILSPLMSGLA